MGRTKCQRDGLTDGCMELNNKVTRCVNDFKFSETPVIKKTIS